MNHMRILTLRDEPSSGDCVVYVMSRDQRVLDNHALLEAQQAANAEHLPLVVVFNLLEKSGVRGREHYTFMLDGLEGVAQHLKDKNIPFMLTSGNPFTRLPDVLQQLGAHSVYFDFSPLHGPRRLAKQIATVIPKTFVVDTHNIVPVWMASQKQEFAAHTFRRKIHLLLEEYLVEPPDVSEQTINFKPPVEGLTFDEARKIAAQQPKRGIVIQHSSGERAARQRLRGFIDVGLDTYALARNDMSQAGQSGLSPYLHFGQLSSLRVALEVLKNVNIRPLLFDEARMAQMSESVNRVDGMNALFEEMIVRKELADNFCLHSASYDSVVSAPEWAQASLKTHQTDPREYLYTLRQFEEAQTHDQAWNAAQLELRKTGKIHGYMRMYWAKKILEWTPSPAQALKIALYLNDAYSIDGGDPNGYVGVLWSIAGLHDRPWIERPIYGKIRYMNAAGLRRKFDIDSYITQWSET